MSELPTYRLTIESTRERIALVEPFLRETISGFDISQRRYHDLLVSLTEAVNNAIIHGNRCDPSKNVVVDVYITQTIIRCVVHDEGEGFDPEHVPDPRLPENLMNEGGRGVFLIRHLSDDVKITSDKSGTIVEITYVR